MPFLLQFAVSAGTFFAMALVGIDIGYIKKVPADKNLLLEMESKNVAQIVVMPSSDFTTYRAGHTFDLLARFEVLVRLIKH